MTPMTEIFLAEVPNLKKISFQVDVFDMTVIRKVPPQLSIIHMNPLHAAASCRNPLEQFMSVHKNGQFNELCFDFRKPQLRSKLIINWQYWIKRFLELIQKGPIKCIKINFTKVVKYLEGFKLAVMVNDGLKTCKCFPNCTQFMFEVHSKVVQCALNGT